MTETIEQKALALAIEVREGDRMRLCPDPTLIFGNWEALCRAIEQHEAFRREVSDAVVEFRNEWVQATPSRQWFQAKFTRFIIAKPDPLVDLCYSMGLKVTGHELRAAIEKRGGKIVWGEG